MKARLVVTGCALAASIASCASVIDIPERRIAEAQTGPKTCKGVLYARVLYDMTGSTREVGNAAGKGEYDALRDISESGGIRGCKLDIDVQDTRYDQAATLAAYSAWAARPEWPQVASVFVQGTPMTEALAPLSAKEQRVLITTAYAGNFGTPVPISTNVDVPSVNDDFAAATITQSKKSPGYPFTFFQGTDYTTSARVGVNFAWSRAAKRVGFFYCTTSSFCTSPVDGGKSFLEQLGSTGVGRDLAIELADDEDAVAQKVVAYFTSELAHKKADPSYDVVDWIWFGNTRATMGYVGRALAIVKRDLGLSVSVVAGNWAVDEALFAACGPACVGIHGVQPFPVFGDLSASGMTNVLRLHDTYRRRDNEENGLYKTVQYVYGYVAVATWRAAIERVVDQGLPVTGANLRTALEAFDNVSIEGFATLNYTPTDHRPQSSARIYRVGVTGALEPVGQPLAIALQPSWLGW